MRFRVLGSPLSSQFAAQMELKSGAVIHHCPLRSRLFGWAWVSGFRCMVFGKPSTPTKVHGFLQAFPILGL